MILCDRCGLPQSDHKNNSSFECRDLSRRVIADLRRLLGDAVEIIHGWHSIRPGCSSVSVEKVMWEIYYRRAPELTEIREAIEENK